jgi:aminoglycoside phosphotransferase (APT) family kinase protein
MKKLPGETLGMAWPRLSTEEKKNIACEVAEYIAELRTHTASKLQAADGNPARYTVISSRHEVMPVTKDREAWRERVEERFSNRDQAWREEFKARYPFITGPYVLSHADLNTSNIMADNGHVSGIIDWEH